MTWVKEKGHVGPLLRTVLMVIAKIRRIGSSESKDSHVLSGAESVLNYVVLNLNVNWSIFKFSMISWHRDGAGHQNSSSRFILQYHGCWWPGDTKHQGISRKGIALVIPEYSSFSTKGKIKYNLALASFQQKYNIAVFSMNIKFSEHCWRCLVMNFEWVKIVQFKISVCKPTSSISRVRWITVKSLI